jgi:hypothetical protein
VKACSYPDTVLCSKRHDETNLNEIGEVISLRAAGDTGSLIEFSTGHRAVGLKKCRDKLAGRSLPAVEPMEESSRHQLGEDIANACSHCLFIHQQRTSHDGAQSVFVLVNLTENRPRIEYNNSVICVSSLQYYLAKYRNIISYMTYFREVKPVPRESGKSYYDTLPRRIYHYDTLLSK